MGTRDYRGSTTAMDKSMRSPSLTGWLNEVDPALRVGDPLAQPRGAYEAVGIYRGDNHIGDVVKDSAVIEQTGLDLTQEEFQTQVRALVESK